MKGNNYIVSRWVLEKGVTDHKISFVVSRDRGYEEYRKVRQQKTKPVYSRYSRSLLNSMFKKWL